MIPQLLFLVLTLISQLISAYQPDSPIFISSMSQSLKLLAVFKLNRGIQPWPLYLGSHFSAESSLCRHPLSIICVPPASFPLFQVTSQILSFSSFFPNLWKKLDIHSFLHYVIYLMLCHIVSTIPSSWIFLFCFVFCFFNSPSDSRQLAVSRAVTLCPELSSYKCKNKVWHIVLLHTIL